MSNTFDQEYKPEHPSTDQEYKSVSITPAERAAFQDRATDAINQFGREYRANQAQVEATRANLSRTGLEDEFGVTSDGRVYTIASGERGTQ